MVPSLRYTQSSASTVCCCQNTLLPLPSHAAMFNTANNATGTICTTPCLTLQNAHVMTHAVVMKE